MQSFALSADSTCDLYADFVREHDIRIAPMRFTVEKGGVVRAIKAPKVAGKPRKFFDDLIKFAQENGAKGMAYIIWTEEGEKSPIVKFLTPEIVAALKQSEMLTTVMCMEIDRLLKQVCEAATQHGYAVVIVGTDGLATRVPQREEVAFPVVKVPCVVVPARGEALEKEDCGREREGSEA